MSIFKRGLGDTPTQLIPSRSSGRVGSVSIDSENALDMSVVWAALALRADMLSTLPLDVFRKFGDVQVEVEKPPVLIHPSGGSMTMREWLYSTQFDLDRVGNCYGIITATDSTGLPREIQLVDHRTVFPRVNPKDGAVTYRIGQTVYLESEVWHERQYTVPGQIMGLSPIAHAAWTLGLYKSAEQFGLEWFGNGGQIPSGHLQNVLTKLTPEQATEAKLRYKEGVANRDIFVTGNDWEFNTVDSASKDAEFLQTQASAELAAARFMGVPADLVDVASNGSSITYANVVQRNLQFLITKLQPIVTRREEALSSWLPAPRFVKFNTDAFLRMDPQTKATVIGGMVDHRLLAPSEARALDNRAPLTDAQWAEFDHLSPKAIPALTSTKGASL